VQSPGKGNRFILRNWFLTGSDGYVSYRRPLPLSQPALHHVPQSSSPEIHSKVPSQEVTSRFPPKFSRPCSRHQFPFRQASQPPSGSLPPVLVPALSSSSNRLSALLRFPLTGSRPPASVPLPAGLTASLRFPSPGSRPRSQFLIKSPLGSSPIPLDRFSSPAQFPFRLLLKATWVPFPGFFSTFQPLRCSDIRQPGKPRITLSHYSCRAMLVLCRS